MRPAVIEVELSRWTTSNILLYYYQSEPIQLTACGFISSKDSERQTYLKSSYHLCTKPRSKWIDPQPQLSTASSNIPAGPTTLSVQYQHWIKDQAKCPELTRGSPSKRSSKRSSSSGIIGSTSAWGTQSY